MNALMIRLREEVITNLTLDWVVFHYHWREDFVYEYFTDYFYHRNECLSSIQNSANLLVSIMNYVYQHEEKMPHDIVCIMNLYVYHYVNELLVSDPVVLERITELHRRHEVAKLLPLLVHRYFPMDIYPIMLSYLKGGY